MHQKLIDHARKMYEQEILLAEKETQKANTLKTKHNKFSNFRVHRHEHSAQKHTLNAQRHQEWLRTQGISTAPPAQHFASTRPGLSAM
jgi:hypothetical protein